MTNRYKMDIEHTILVCFFLIAAVLFSTYFAAGVKADDALEVPYQADSSNRAGWWAPMEVYNGDVYMAFNGKGAADTTHTMQIAKRSSSGLWTLLKCYEDSNKTIMEYENDPGHRQSSMAIDGSGRIHIFGSMHTSPWNYYRSEENGDNLINYSAEMPDNNTTFTYPVVKAAPNGDVYLIARADTYLEDEEIIDFGDSGYSEDGSSWASSSVTGYNDSSTRYLPAAAGNGQYARWTPGTLSEGLYDIYVYKAYATNNISQEYTIVHNGVTDTQSVDFTANPSGWVKLGNYYMGGTGNDYVQLTKNTAGIHRADAVKFTRKKREGKLYRWDNTSGTWSCLGAFASENGKAVYPDDIQIDPNGDVHILYEWSEFPSSGYRHKLSYMKYSPSTGQWYNHLGSAMNVPVDTSGSDIIQDMDSPDEVWTAAGDETDNYTGPAVQTAKMNVDLSGRVCVVYRHRDITDGVFKIKTASTNVGSSWEKEVVYANGSTTASVDITVNGTDRHIYYCKSGGSDRAFVAIRASDGNYTHESLAPGVIVTNLSVIRSLGKDYLYLVNYNGTKLKLILNTYGPTPDKLEIYDPIFYDFNKSKTIDSFSEAQLEHINYFKIDVAVANNVLGSAKKVIVYAALYSSEGKLKRVVMDRNLQLAAGMTDILECNMDLDGLYSPGDYMKVFTWDGMETLTPLRKIYDFN